jgi:MFS family permease
MGRPTRLIASGKSGTTMAIFLILALNVLVFSAFTGGRIIFSLYGLALGASPAQIGGIMAMLYLFPLLLSWPIGVLSDRYPARWLLAAGTGVGACGMLAPWLFPSLASLCVATSLLGLTLAFATVLGQSLVGSLSEPGQRTRNFSNYAVAGSVAVFVGPLIAGFSIDQFGYGLTCAGLAVVLMSGVVFLLVWGKSLPHSEPKSRSVGNLFHTLADRRLWGMLAVSSLAQLGNDIFLTFLPIHAHAAGHSATTIGAMFSALAAGSLGVRLAMVRLIDRLGESRLLATAFYLGAAVFVLLPLVKAPTVLAGLALVFGMCQGCTQPLTMMLMFNSAEEGRTGESIGLRMTVNNATRMIGPAIFGGLASLAGLLVVFWINGLLMTAGGRMSDPRPDGKPPRAG